MSARSEFTTVDSMPVALNNPSSPMPGSIASAPGAGASTAGAAAASGLSADFLALLARMNITLAPDAQAKVVAAMASFGDPADPSALPEIGELLETSAPEADKDKDVETDEDDEAIAAALGLPALILSMTVPVAPALETSASDRRRRRYRCRFTARQVRGRENFARRNACGPDSATARVAVRAAVLAGYVARAKGFARSFRHRTTMAPKPPIPPPTTASTSSLNTLPAHLHALSTHTQSGQDHGARELRAPVGTHAWTQQLGDELAWMAQQGRDAASLKLSPEHLGPLEVRISMREGEASVWFGAANADTRSALEQALPRLRELFASQGLALADAGVFREAPRQQNRSPSFDRQRAPTGFRHRGRAVIRRCFRGRAPARHLRLEKAGPPLRSPLRASRQCALPHSRHAQCVTGFTRRFFVTIQWHERCKGPWHRTLTQGLKSDG